MLTGLGKYSIVASREGSLNITKRTAFANMQGGGNYGRSFGSGFGNRGGTDDTVLKGFLDETNEQQFRAYYKDMYYSDPVCGAIVDLFSNMPFSDFDLTGVRDSKVLDTYMRSIENMRIKTLLPNISIDYLVYGVFVATMNFDTERRIFNALIPHDINMCELKYIPVFGMDPLVDVRVSPELKSLFSKPDDRLDKIKSQIPKMLIDAAQEGGVMQLEPGSTLYIPRRTLSTTWSGTSLFRRLIPLHLYEKSILRGSIEASGRRTRSILHIMVGDDMWEPTQEDLTAVANLFMEADIDPINAVIATRQAIQTSEVRSPSDFLRWDEMFDTFTNVKLKAVGLSDTFLSGDATINAMDQALSVLVEQLLAYRNYIARELFFDKMFPAIASANNFRKRVTSEANEISSRVRRYGKDQYIATADGNAEFDHQMFEIDDITKYDIPSISWRKKLRPEADQTYLDLLRSLTEMGIPVPIRLLATAGGVDLDEVMKGMDDDIEMRELIKERTKDIMPKEEEEASVIDTLINGKDKLKRKPWYKRDFEDKMQVYASNGKGKRLLTTPRERKRIEDQINKNMAAALAANAQKQNHHAKMAKVTESRIFGYLGGKK